MNSPFQTSEPLPPGLHSCTPQDTASNTSRAPDDTKVEAKVLLELPNELLYRILSNLAPEDLFLRLHATCRHLRMLVDEHASSDWVEKELPNYMGVLAERAASHHNSSLLRKIVTGSHRLRLGRPSAYALIPKTLISDFRGNHTVWWEGSVTDPKVSFMQLRGIHQNVPITINFFNENDQCRSNNRVSQLCSTYDAGAVALLESWDESDPLSWPSVVRLKFFEKEPKIWHAHLKCSNNTAAVGKHHLYIAASSPRDDDRLSIMCLEKGSVIAELTAPTFPAVIDIKRQLYIPPNERFIVVVHVNKYALIHYQKLEVYVMEKSPEDNVNYETAQRIENEQIRKYLIQKLSEQHPQYQDTQPRLEETPDHTRHIHDFIVEIPDMALMLHETGILKPHLGYKLGRRNKVIPQEGLFIVNEPVGVWPKQHPSRRAPGSLPGSDHDALFNPETQWNLQHIFCAIRINHYPVIVSRPASGEKQAAKPPYVPLTGPTEVRSWDNESGTIFPEVPYPRFGEWETTKWDGEVLWMKAGEWVLAVEFT